MFPGMWLKGFWPEVWCARKDLNLHTLRYQILSLARLPIPPRAQPRILLIYFPRTSSAVLLANPSVQIEVMVRSFHPIVSSRGERHGRSRSFSTFILQDAPTSCLTN